MSMALLVLCVTGNAGSYPGRLSALMQSPTGKLPHPPLMHPGGVAASNSKSQMLEHEEGHMDLYAHLTSGNGKIPVG